MKTIKLIIKNMKKYKSNVLFKAKFMYTKYYEKLSIKENEILIESFNGKNFNGSPYYILQELCNNTSYKNYIKYIVAQKNYVEELESMVKRLGLKNVIVLQGNSKQYCKILAEAKYLINNVTFPVYFIKKPGQIYLNTWHGTPLKGLGRKIKDNPNSIGNVQRNFLMSDYLLYPNNYTFDHMRKDYMIEQFYKGKYILSGYPCNDILFNDEARESLKQKLGISDKKIIVYMPTWRDKIKGKKQNKQFFYIMHALYSLENKLDENTIVFVKLHHLASGQIEFSDFEKIKPFPKEYETYEILNLADVLITDYSSVMFDYACTGKKIVLYTYDKEEYMNSRSIYFDIDELPFIATDNIDILCQEIKNEVNYQDYKEFQEKFCLLNDGNATKKLCDYIFNGKVYEKMEIIDGEKYKNNKQNILIYAGELAKNGLTTALIGLLNYIDLDEKNYCLTFYKKKTDANKSIINEFNDKISYIPIQGQKNLTIWEAICQYLYFKSNINNKLIQKNLKKIFEREIRRDFPTMNFDYVIHFTGYERHIIHLFNSMDATKIIYTHNDLKQERKTRNNIHMKSFKKAYKDYDKIAIIRETMKQEIKNNVKNVDLSKINIAHNVNNIEELKEKAKQKITFDDDTYCNYSLEELNDILNDKSKIKYIDIARYSYEKGLDRLIEAFSIYHKQNRDTYLIIIGGHGKEFQTIKKMVIEQNLENIVIIKSLKNPYTILNKCNAFILSSRYEGLPMTIMEALILNKPVISTSISGPKEFLENGYGYLVENSMEGLLEGFHAYKDGKLNNLTKFDSEEFNNVAIKEFYDLLK